MIRVVVIIVAFGLYACSDCYIGEVWTNRTPPPEMVSTFRDAGVQPDALATDRDACLLLCGSRGVTKCYYDLNCVPRWDSSVNCGEIHDGAVVGVATVHVFCAATICRRLGL